MTLTNVCKQISLLCCYSDVPGLCTGSLNLIWSQQENFAFILVMYMYVLGSNANLTV